MSPNQIGIFPSLRTEGNETAPAESVTQTGMQGTSPLLIINTNAKKKKMQFTLT